MFMPDRPMAARTSLAIQLYSQGLSRLRCLIFCLAVLSFGPSPLHRLVSQITKIKIFQNVLKSQEAGSTTLTFSELFNPRTREELHADTHGSTDDPTSINAILFQGTSCVPSVVNPFATHCTLGSYPPLTVNVSTVAQIQLAINLARNLNIRLVIKNTGHDFGAKSTGAGSCELFRYFYTSL